MLFNQNDNLFISVWVLLVKRQSRFNDKKTGLQCFPLNVTASFSYESLYPPNIILDVTAKWGDLNYNFYGEKLQELLLNHWKIDNLKHAAFGELLKVWSDSIIREKRIVVDLYWLLRGTDGKFEFSVSISLIWSSSLCFVSTGGHKIALCAWKNFGRLYYKQSFVLAL